MTAWEVFGIITAIVAFLILVGTPIIKFSTVLTKLTSAVENLAKLLDKNDECHTEFSDKIGEHETRISIIEDWRKGAD